MGRKEKKKKLEKVANSLKEKKKIVGEIFIDKVNTITYLSDSIKLIFIKKKESYYYYFFILWYLEIKIIIKKQVVLIQKRR